MEEQKVNSRVEGAGAAQVANTVVESSVAVTAVGTGMVEVMAKGSAAASRVVGGLVAAVVSAVPSQAGRVVRWVAMAVRKGTWSVAVSNQCRYTGSGKSVQHLGIRRSSEHLHLRFAHRTNGNCRLDLRQWSASCRRPHTLRVPISRHRSPSYRLMWRSPRSQPCTTRRLHRALRGGGTLASTLGILAG